MNFIDFSNFRFEQHIKLCLQGKLEWKELKSCVPTRKQSEVIAHFHKLKYRYLKDSDLYKNNTNREEILKLLKNFRNLKKTKKKEYIKLQDNLTKKSITIEKSLLEKLIDCQHHKNKEDKMITIKLDEEVLKVVFQMKLRSAQMKLLIQNDIKKNSETEFQLNECTEFYIENPTFNMVSNFDSERGEIQYLPEIFNKLNYNKFSSNNNFFVNPFNKTNNEDCLDNENNTKFNYDLFTKDYKLENLSKSNLYDYKFMMDNPSIHGINFPIEFGSEHKVNSLI